VRSGANFLSAAHSAAALSLSSCGNIAHERESSSSRSSPSLLVALLLPLLSFPAFALSLTSASLPKTKQTEQQLPGNLVAGHSPRAAATPPCALLLRHPKAAAVVRGQSSPLNYSQRMISNQQHFSAPRAGSTSSLAFSSSTAHRESEEVTGRGHFVSAAFAPTRCQRHGWICIGKESCMISADNCARGFLVVRGRACLLRDPFWNETLVGCS
jgi:hypothetical protein